MSDAHVPPIGAPPDEARSGIVTSGNRVKAIPKPFPRPDMETNRDSGCFTGSPASLPSGCSANAPYCFFAGGSTSGTIKSTSEVFQAEDSQSDEGEEIFHMSVEQEGPDEVFVDSGVHAESSGIRIVGSSIFYLSQDSLDQLEGSSDDTDEEFSTAEFDPSWVTSAPIHIPGRDDRDANVCAVQSLPSRLRPTGLISATQSGNTPDTHNQRPGSGNARLHVAQPHTSDGSAGPLPDLVMTTRMRERAQSESVVWRSDQQSIGMSLRQMSDEFSQTVLARRRSIMQIEQHKVNEQR